jgi:hypothetical protein
MERQSREEWLKHLHAELASQITRNKNPKGTFRLRYMPKSEIALVDCDRDMPLVELAGNEPFTMTMQKGQGIVAINARGMKLTKIADKQDGILFLIEPDLGIKDLR